MPAITEHGALEEADVASVAEAVSAFARRELAHLSEHPEREVDSDELKRLVTVAGELGLVGGESPLRLWGAVQDPVGLRVSKQILVRLAEARAGVGFHLHTLALGDFLCTRLGLPRDGATIPLLQARPGLARGALAPFLAGAEMDEETRRLARDTLILPGGRGVGRGGAGWQRAVAPVFVDGSRVLEWRLIERAEDTVSIWDTALGLDETPGITMRMEPSALAAATTAEVAPAEALRLFTIALALDAIAAVATALGACRAARARSTAYATERVQGGVPIGEHPAVQLLLGRVDANIGAVAALLEVAAVPQDLAGLNDLLRLRAVAHPLLCRAATDALQVFGGYGYMRDFGLERILRDNQQLKIHAATPTDIELFLGAQGGTP